jgi:hypothetical protein
LVEVSIVSKDQQGHLLNQGKQLLLSLWLGHRCHLRSWKVGDFVLVLASFLLSWIGGQLN